MTAVLMVSSRRVRGRMVPWRGEGGGTLAHAVSHVLSALAAGALRHPPAEPQARADYDRNNDPGRADQSGHLRPATNSSMTMRLQPIARGYETTCRPGVRKSLLTSSAISARPAIAVNDVLQGNFSRSWNTLQRFVINTTVRRCGAVRRGDRLGSARSPRRFRADPRRVGCGTQAPAFKLPLFGPSTCAIASERVIDLVSNPTNYIPGGAAATVSTAPAA